MTKNNDIGTPQFGKKEHCKSSLKTFFLYIFLAIHSPFFIHTAAHEKFPQKLWPSDPYATPWFCRSHTGFAYKMPLARSKAVARHMRNTLIEWLCSTPDKNSDTNAQQKLPQAPSYPVRVLLAQTALDEPISWTLTSHNGFIIYNPSHKESIRTMQNHVCIANRYGHWYLNNQRMTSEILHIIPVEGHTQFAQHEYKGIFIVTRADDELYLINNLDLEEYICGVLRTESWPGWPLEVNKVLAIACRSYAMAMIMRAQYTKLPYHIRNTNYHQTYGGVHNNTIHRTAVEQTRGVFLAYNNEPILAMFDGCCGGVIPAHIAGFNFDKVPYLARQYACNYCKSCKIYTWQAEYTVHEFLQRIKKKSSFTKLKSITISKKDKAGLVKEVKIKGHGKHSACLTGKQLYSLLKEVKSFCFSITHQGDRITLKGRGFGHHCGLCQWGACQMVHNGRDHKSILQYYYPGTTFMKLELFRNA